MSAKKEKLNIFEKHTASCTHMIRFELRIMERGDVQGYPKRMRLQRQLVIYTVCFHIFNK